MTPIDLLEQQRVDLVRIVEGGKWSEVEAWHARTRPIVAKHFGDYLAKFDEYKKVRWMLGTGSMRVGASEFKKATDALLGLLDGIVEVEGVSTGSTPRVASNSCNVFIVHGHDKAMKEACARAITNLGLTPIILHEKPNQGRTIIEKFEHNSDVSFAVVLLSPDDAPSKVGGQRRARQNVVLELGYFIGKLGRNRVVALKCGDVDIPSDITGVVYTPFDDAGYWQYELAKELKTAGYDVDANKLL